MLRNCPGRGQRVGHRTTNRVIGQQQRVRLASACAPCAPAWRDPRVFSKATMRPPFGDRLLNAASTTCHRHFPAAPAKDFLPMLANIDDAVERRTLRQETRR